MRRLILHIALFASQGVFADRLIPVISGTIGDRTYRTTVELRSSTTEVCRFDLRGAGDAAFHSVEHVEADVPKVLGNFPNGCEPFASAVRVSCTGSVDVHSRISESADGGASYDDGSLFRAAVATPLANGETYTRQIAGNFILAEIEGAAARVSASLTATSSNRVADRQYDLPPFGECSVRMARVLRSLGPIIGRFSVAGEGSVIMISEVTDHAMADRALRVPAQTRAGGDAQIAVAPPPADLTLSTAEQLLISPFKAAPFRDPATGLVYMRARWYDPSTGSFLSPDPMGYEDSSNLYAFAGGDPVNRRDPTGEAASLGQSGWIIATRRNGGFRKISPQEIAADPAGIRKFLMTESGLYWREAYDMVERAGHAERPTPMLRAVARGTQMAEPMVNATSTGLVVMSSFTGVGGAAQLTQAFVDKGATKTNVAMAGLTLVGLGVADDLVRLGTTQADNIAAVAETGARVGFTQQTTQRMLAAGRTVKHHLFNKFRGSSPGSQKYRDFFKQHGIDVDQYAVEIPEAMHQKLIHGAGKNWTIRWKEWIDANPNATTTEVYQFAGRLMDEYGLSGLPIIPYR